jgi:hypothetical protein
VEIIELKDHPFFIGVQFHPEFKSKPQFPHPLFKSFVEAAIAHRDRKISSANTKSSTSPIHLKKEKVDPKNNGALKANLEQQEVIGTANENC